MPLPDQWRIMMIYVDVYAPSVDEVYDFEVDENCLVEEMTAGIARVLHKKTASFGEPLTEGFSVFSKRDGCVLPPDRTVCECGIESGCRLILA